MQDFESLWPHRRVQRRYPSDVSFGAAQTGHEPKGDRISTDFENDWYGRGRRLRRERGRITSSRDQKLRSSADEVGRQARHSVELGLRPAVLDRDVSTFEIPGF